MPQGDVPDWILQELEGGQADSRLVDERNSLPPDLRNGKVAFVSYSYERPCELAASNYSLVRSGEAEHP